METLHELEESLAAQEPPAAQPRAIQAQQVALQEIRHEIDQTKPEVNDRLLLLYVLRNSSSLNIVSLF